MTRMIELGICNSSCRYAIMLIGAFIFVIFLEAVKTNKVVKFFLVVKWRGEIDSKTASDRRKQELLVLLCNRMVKVRRQNFNWET